MHLLNGTSAARARSSDGVTVLECGCAYSEKAWLQMCDAEYSAWHDRHVAAAIAHRATLAQPLSGHNPTAESIPGQE